ncbi:hypothetical protein [Limosilactobacillus sp.]|uniref:hypothetical protein n=1 Tax=Limosilactobacillus sp. TaxID=2773925 RepID=UPI00345ECED3
MNKSNHQLTTATKRKFFAISLIIIMWLGFLLHDQTINILITLLVSFYLIFDAFHREEK